jgi:hypothetical protein
MQRVTLYFCTHRPSVNQGVSGSSPERSAKSKTSESRVGSGFQRNKKAEIYALQRFTLKQKVKHCI